MNYMQRKLLPLAIMAAVGSDGAGAGDGGAVAEETSKRKSIKTVDAEKLAKGIYEAKFNDGTVVTADLNDIAQEHKDAMVAKFLAYGLKQKLDDSMAGAEDTKTAIEELVSTWDAIKAGGWTSRVPGEGVEGGLFARAYSERHGISLSDAKTKIGTLVEKNLAANVAKNAGKKDAPAITDRMVLNAIRTAALERDADLNTIYEALKAKRAAKKKSTKSAMEIDLSAE